MSAAGGPPAIAAFDVEAPAAAPAGAHAPAAASGGGGGAAAASAGLSAADAPLASPWEDTERDPLFSDAHGGNEGLTSPSGRSAGGDILAGLRALTFDPLVGTARFAGGAVASVLPQGFKDGAKKGADALKDGFLTGAGAVKGGLVKTGDAIASAMPQELRDGLKTTAEAAQRGAQYAVDAATAGAAMAKDVAVEGAGVVISVLPQEFKDVAAVSREAVEKLAEAGRAVERLLKDKAWRNMQAGGQKKGKKPFFNYYRAHLAYVLGTCTFFGGLMLMKDPNPPDNIVDSIFMTISAMSGAGLTTIPMSDMSHFGLGCIYILMLMGGICFLLLPPVLYRLYQYRQFKPMVQEVLQLRKVIRARAGEEHEADAEEVHNDLMADFELQDEGLLVLAKVIITYNLSFIVLGTFIYHAILMSYGPLAALQERGINHFWFSMFATVSSFNNVGFSLLDDNYTQLADRPGCLLIMCLYIIAGNTGLPVFLRAIFALLGRLRPNNRAIRFVLDNPRRCTTAFFNTKQSVALAVILCGNLLLQYTFFLTTSMHLPAIRDTAPRDQLAVMGFFTSVSTRAAGMNVFDLRALSKANVVVFCVMMYVSSAPMVSMMQSSKQEVVAKYVNGELLLVYEGGESNEEEEKAVYKKYLNSHIRWLGVFFLVIATAEERVLDTMPPVNLFDILFEIMSGYGTSGLSMGAPGKPYSLCGEFNNFSKIILCIVKLMGKHRGLPSNTDAALDGQFHKIHGLLEELQTLGTKQREAAQARANGVAVVSGAVDAAKAAAEGVQRRIALQRQGGAGPYEQLENEVEEEVTPAALEGFTLRPSS